MVAGSRKGKKHKPSHFFRFSCFSHKIWGLAHVKAKSAPVWRKIIARLGNDSGGWEGDFAALRQDGPNFLSDNRQAPHGSSLWA